MNDAMRTAAAVFAAVDGGSVESYGEWGGMGQSYWRAGVDLADPLITAVRCTVSAVAG